MTDAEADEHTRLVAATGEIENMSAAISHQACQLPAATFARSNLAIWRVD
jgi:hypothetical protein